PPPRPHAKDSPLGPPEVLSVDGGRKLHAAEEQNDPENWKREQPEHRGHRVCVEQGEGKEQAAEYYEGPTGSGPDPHVACQAASAAAHRNATKRRRHEIHE